MEQQPKDQPAQARKAWTTPQIETVKMTETESGTNNGPETFITTTNPALS